VATVREPEPAILAKLKALGGAAEAEPMAAPQVGPRLADSGSVRGCGSSGKLGVLLKDRNRSLHCRPAFVAKNNQQECLRTHG
jgi:hypothetical protein